MGGLAHNRRVMEEPGVRKRPTTAVDGRDADVCVPSVGKRPSPIRSGPPADVCVPSVSKRPEPPEPEADLDVCRRATWPDRAIAQIAQRQQGLITRDQLFELGLSRALIDKAVRRRRLIAVHRGVYAVGHLSLPPFAPYMAAVLAVGKAAYVSHGSAATLWGLHDRLPGDIEVTVVGRDAGRRRAGVRVHSLASLDAADTSHRHRIPVTTSARALLDVTPRLTARELERAFDRVLKQRITTRHAVAEAVARSPRRPGARRLAALAAGELRVPADTRSVAEERLLALIRAGGLPAPEINARIGPYTVDVLWRTQRLVVEIDGYAFHSTRWSFESDHERDLVLGAAGFTVMRFTSEQVLRQPESVLVRLTQRLAAAEGQLRRSSRIVG